MKIAIVTGASSGMGREFVRQLGYFYRGLDEIWVIARRRERLEKLSGKVRTPLRIFDGDLTKKQVFRRLEEALTEYRPDIRMDLKQQSIRMQTILLLRQSFSLNWDS